MSGLLQPLQPPFGQGSPIASGEPPPVPIWSSNLKCTLKDYVDLVAKLLDAFVAAFNLQRADQGFHLRFREVMCGRVKMMTALCLAWANTCQSTYLGYNSDQLRRGNFRLPEFAKRCPMPPTFRVLTKMTGIESTCCRLFTDRSIRPAVSPNNSVRILYGSVI